MKNYVSLSLETHLFFGRIMKEHALFLKTGFQSKNKNHMKQADWYRAQFEELLRWTVSVSDRAVRANVLESGEIVTEFTQEAERSTSYLTGTPIDSRITRAEERLRCGCMEENSQLRRQVRMLNEKALRLLRGLIEFKEQILADVTSCRLFTSNYPLLIQHIIREAKLYQSIVRELEKSGTICHESLWSMESFWNQIMMEHAQFIRGLLDPSEEELIATADGFAKEYERLLQEVKEKNDRTMDGLTRKTLETTVRYRDFKAAGTKGIEKCQIASIILPLLADHVLREANHYLRLLEEECAC